MSFQDLGAGPARGPANRGPSGDGTQRLAASIFQLKTAVNTYQKDVNTLGTPKDTPKLREKLAKTNAHISELAKKATDELKAASGRDHTANVGLERKRQDTKLAADLQRVLNDFSKAQREALDREKKYIPYVPKESQNPDSLHIQVEGGSRDERQTLLVQQQRQEVLNLEADLDYNEALIVEREEGIRDIQGQILEVHETFKDLAQLVQEQGSSIDLIDSNLVSTDESMIRANKELRGAAKRQKSNASTACCLMVFFSLALIIIVFVMVA
ncbi:Syntaxin/epimorphin family [Klebsormidium nitens]|uniref:Syntaxin/epimorphin family n=1 Tax=Klebsormidium nitens TaxID=105231 RepID=A0A1Y1HYD3_KLENI|nr:Syntaxin/epimorphin family [Klebsormidium nitens]|eukprot:GAQ81536.1 Syntaxin/epimorphin family [Klebsormidium nitens]